MSGAYLCSVWQIATDISYRFENRCFRCTRPEDHVFLMKRMRELVHGCRNARPNLLESAAVHLRRPFIRCADEVI